MTSPVARRIAGTAMLVAVLALATLGFHYRFARSDAAVDFTIQAAQSGIGMQAGTDLKVRGIAVGRIVAVDLDETGTPVLTGRLDPGVEVPKGNLTVSITPKTFFGEKQIDMSYPLEQFGQGPFLANGDVVESTQNLIEVEDVLVTLQPLLDGIDDNDLATLFEASAALEGEGRNIARNLEVSAELARFGTSISDDAVRNARLLTSFANQLTTGADEFDRLNAALPGAVAILSERQAEIETNLEALSSFALTVAQWINVEEGRLDELLDRGGLVGEFLERNVESIPSIIDGITLFADVQSRPSPYLDDDTIYVPFKIFLQIDEGLEGLLGPLFGPLTELGGS